MTLAARVTGTDAGAGRIIKLQEQLAVAPAHGRERRSLLASISVEAAAFRKSLDAEQAAASAKTTRQFRAWR